MCRCNGKIVENKRETAGMYKKFFAELGIPFVTETENSRANKHCERTEVPNAEWLEDHLVNIPSSVRTCTR